jgi:hypothetical protein
MGMIIDNVQTIVFRCVYCGAFHFEEFMIFDFSGKKQKTMYCKCEMGYVKMYMNRSRQLCVEIPCFICNKSHTYTFTLEQLLKKPVLILKCMYKHMEIAFLGSDSEVRHALDQHESSLDRVLDACGMPPSCVNIEVMMESINSIHDLAEKNGVYCECGKGQIHMMIFSDRIKLFCTSCDNNLFFFTRDNQDLKYVSTKKQIVLEKCTISKACTHSILTQKHL